MSIGSAMERGSAVYVYDEKGHLLFSKPGKLIGYMTDLSYNRKL